MRVGSAWVGGLLLSTWCTCSAATVFAQDDASVAPGGAAPSTPAAPADPAETPEAEAVSAQEDAYRRWVDEALREYSIGHYAEAGVLLQRAHAARPSARTLRGLGMVAFELRDYPRAVAHLTAALASDARALDGEMRVATEALLARAQAFVARLVLRVTPESATVRIGGTEVAVDAPVTLSVGEHQIEVAADGHVSRTLQVRLEAGREEVVRVELLPLGSSSPSLDEPAEPTSKRRPWLWGTLGVVGVGVAAVAGALLITRDRGAEEPFDNSSGGFVVFGE